MKSKGKGCKRLWLLYSRAGFELACVVNRGNVVSKVLRIVPNAPLVFLNFGPRRGSSVVGMARPVSDSCALVLARGFYKKVVGLHNPAVVIQLTRRKVGERSNWSDPTWLAPILYS